MALRQSKLFDQVKLTRAYLTATSSFVTHALELVMKERAVFGRPNMPLEKVKAPQMAFNT